MPNSLISLNSVAGVGAETQLYALIDTSVDFATVQKSLL